MSRTKAKPLTPQFFARDTLTVARALIGVRMEFGGCAGRIVEVEAYTNDDASHARTRTERSAIMFDTYGHIYVYFIYGMYHCLNFTTEKNSMGAVLIRAVEPLDGISKMKKRRGTEIEHLLCNGPGKLCEAFGIDLKLTGSKIGDKIKLYHGDAGEIASGKRIGIQKAVELEWRFWEAGNTFVSRQK